MTRYRRQRRVPLSLLALAAICLIVVAASLAYSHRSAETKKGCADVPMAPIVTPQTYPSSFLWPYGAVYACRAIDREAHLFGKVDVSFVLLLETDKGPALVRMEYSNLDLGRQYVAQATELKPAGHGLSDDDIHRIDQAIAGRGGLQTQPWVVHYGDG